MSENNKPSLWARLADKRAARYLKKATKHNERFAIFCAQHEEEKDFVQKNKIWKQMRHEDAKIIKYRSKWYNTKTSWWIDAPLGMDAKDFNPKRNPFPIKGDNETLSSEELEKRNASLRVAEDTSVKVNIVIDENHRDYVHWNPTFTEEEFEDWKKNSETGQKITAQNERVKELQKQWRRDKLYDDSND